MKHYEVQVHFENKGQMSFFMETKDIREFLSGFVKSPFAIGESKQKAFLINMPLVTSIIARELEEEEILYANGAHNHDERADNHVGYRKDCQESQFTWSEKS